MASGWFSGRAIELVRARSLFVKVTPIPASLSQRRAVLHALQQYGQIEIFKRLPNPETFVCVPTKMESVTELLKRSPLTFIFVSENPASIQFESIPGISPVGVASAIEIHEDTAGGVQPDKPDPAQSDVIKAFTLHINPSQSYYEHKRNIRLSALHGPWPRTMEQDQDFIYHALKGVVPDTIARAGLCDWHTGGQLSDEMKALRAQQSAKLWHIRERQMRKKSSKEVAVMDENALVVVDSLDALSKSIHNDEAPADRARIPAWRRRMQFKLNPLATGKERPSDQSIAAAKGTNGGLEGGGAPPLNQAR